MPQSSFRRDWITKPIFRMAAHALPRLSDTEREAIEAGDVWWDADLFTGNPDWNKLLAFAPAKLSEEEQQFLDGPVEELCRMLNDWKINWEWHDLPPEVWDFLKSRKFFAMIIPKQYGGLGFSAYAHSEVIRKLSTRSICAACTAMVPNSLGPGELLMQFGTEAQRDYWLPRLARGEEIPCFGLTSPEAGSDAASMLDTGVVCRGTYDGKEVLGIRLNWHKRYITLGPIATVLGLAFKLRDPDHLIGDRDEIGITLALVPTHLARHQHRPASSAGHARVPERTELGSRRLHPDGQCHRRRRPGRQGLENADERAGRRTRHFAAVAVGGRRRVLRQHHRRLCAHPRTIPRRDREVRGDPGTARPHRRDRLSARRRAPHDLRRARRRTSSGRRHRDHEIAGDRPHARRRQ